jgi:hypothetical protein
MSDQSQYGSNDSSQYSSQYSYDTEDDSEYDSEEQYYYRTIRMDRIPESPMSPITDVFFERRSSTFPNPRLSFLNDIEISGLTDVSYSDVNMTGTSSCDCGGFSAWSSSSSDESSSSSSGSLSSDTYRAIQMARLRVQRRRRRRRTPTTLPASPFREIRLGYQADVEMNTDDEMSSEGSDGSTVYYTAPSTPLGGNESSPVGNNVGGDDASSEPMDAVESSSESFVIVEHDEANDGADQATEDSENADLGEKSDGNGLEPSDDSSSSSSSSESPESELDYGNRPNTMVIRRLLEVRIPPRAAPVTEQDSEGDEAGEQDDEEDEDEDAESSSSSDNSNSHHDSDDSDDHDGSAPQPAAAAAAQPPPPPARTIAADRPRRDQPRVNYRDVRPYGTSGKKASSTRQAKKNTRSPRANGVRKKRRGANTPGQVAKPRRRPAVAPCDGLDNRADAVLAAMGDIADFAQQNRAQLGAGDVLNAFAQIERDVPGMANAQTYELEMQIHWEMDNARPEAREARAREFRKAAPSPEPNEDVVDEEEVAVGSEDKADVQFDVLEPPNPFPINLSPIIFSPIKLDSDDSNDLFSLSDGEDRDSRSDSGPDVKQEDDNLDSEQEEDVNVDEEYSSSSSFSSSLTSDEIDVARRWAEIETDGIDEADDEL